jgi:hypothetical protein
MSVDKDETNAPAGPGAGYEKTDAQAGATYRAGLYILGTMFLVAALVVPAYRLLVRQEEAAQKPPAFVAPDAVQPPAAAYPRLVTSEPAVLAAYREKEQELLTSYGWVEKDRGVARMPVAEAMRIVGERGALPTFAPTAAPDAGASPAPAGGGR